MRLSGEYPVRTVCEVVGLSRSSYSYQGQTVTDEDEELGKAIQAVALEWPTYGYRRVTVQLKREGRRANGKRVRRLMHELKLVAQAPKRRIHTTNSVHDFGRYPNLVEVLQISTPNEVWVADITDVRLADSFVSLAVRRDVFTRMIRGWELSRSLDQRLTLTALQRALTDGAPKIHHSDQGVQYAANAYVDCLHRHGVSISMAAIGKPEENGYAERLMRTIKEEEVNLSDYADFHDASRQIGRFLDDVYSHKRIHSALGYLTPAEFQSQWAAEQLFGSSP